MATAGEDCCVRVYDVAAGMTLTATLEKHAGPVWQVAFAHPRVGSYLASCGHDRRVVVWKETAPNTWAPICDYTQHSLTVNTVAWAPAELGLVLACGSADGRVSLLVSRDGASFQPLQLDLGAGGINSIAWAPALYPGQILTSPPAKPQLQRLFAAACCDGTIRIVEVAENGSLTPKETLRGHTKWVRSVAFAPNGTALELRLVSGGDEGAVVVWSKKNMNGEFVPAPVHNAGAPVWKVSFSEAGTTLAVAAGESSVALFRELPENPGKWTQVTTIDDPAAAEAPAEAH